MKRWEKCNPTLKESALSAINMHVNWGLLSASGWVQTSRRREGHRDHTWPTGPSRRFFMSQGSPLSSLDGEGPCCPVCGWDKQGHPCTEVSLRRSQEGTSHVPCSLPRQREEQAGLGQPSHHDSYHFTSLVFFAWLSQPQLPIQHFP